MLNLMKYPVKISISEEENANRPLLAANVYEFDLKDPGI